MTTTWSMSNADLRILADLMTDSDRIDVDLGLASKDFARAQVAAQYPAAPEPLVHISAPDETYDPADGLPPWEVTGDLRQGDEANYEWTGPVMAAAVEAGLKVEDDTETSCSYFYCDDEATAKRLAEIIDEVVAAGLPS